MKVHRYLWNYCRVNWRQITFGGSKRVPFNWKKLFSYFYLHSGVEIHIPEWYFGVTPVSMQYNILDTIYCISYEAYKLVLSLYKAAKIHSVTEIRLCILARRGVNGWIYSSGRLLLLMNTHPKKNQNQVQKKLFCYL